MAADRHPGPGLEARRRNGIKAIKAAQRALDLDDATYRTMLATLTGKTSATELSMAQIAFPTGVGMNRVLCSRGCASSGVGMNRTR